MLTQHNTYMVAGLTTPLFSACKALRRRVWRVLPDERGSVTVEFAIWFPFVMTILALIIDVVMIYNGQSRVLSAIQDANRMRAVGTLSSDVDTETYVANYLKQVLTGRAVVSSSVSRGVVSTSVQLPSRDLQAIGVFHSLTGDLTITVDAKQVIENWEI